MTPTVQSLDHLVLTVADLNVTLAFYTEVLGMRAERFTPADGSQRWALRFGSQKINLHQAGAEFLPKAARPTTGSADLCFLSDTPLADWQAHLDALKISPEEGPVRRSGAEGPILSLYLRDPDGTLIELSNRL
ncbi:VOC family protein [Salipiger bermudensis]|uniref:Probable ring-cleaving dioxygenase n=1 Tax=Salipiger bermudensis (strain DSM 26914 / JCM 13377 / KCTC 12554 / HTCC2601) TaxID=314265 RepID=Q0FQK5_SALBH|nr:VOC family protein [Salipiger bermudensis]EAU46446.1 probable ring-cleaving dioxygenase [Salipiger bermudensis HTCC2601]